MPRKSKSWGLRCVLAIDAMDKNLVAKDSANGRSLGANLLTIVLNGNTCDKVTSGAATQVQVLFGCPGSSPPPFIP